MSATLSSTRFIETHYPFRRSSEKQTGIPATVVGNISEWLHGEVIRTCPNLGSFATPTARLFLRRIFEPVARIADNTNVNIVRIGQELGR